MITLAFSDFPRIIATKKVIEKTERIVAKRNIVPENETKLKDPRI
jgi:hypothetical protein